MPTKQLIGWYKVINYNAPSDEDIPDAQRTIVPNFIEAVVRGGILIGNMAQNFVNYVCIWHVSGHDLF